MRNTILLLCLLTLIGLATGGCWPLGDADVEQPATPTLTPPRVEDAGYSSPSVEGRILYARQGNIWVRSGTSAQRLTEGKWATQPRWSPDGRQIVFVVKEEGYSDLWVMAADGSNQLQITNSRSTAAPGTPEFAHNSFWAFQPQWIPPDGAWIGYVSHIRPLNLTNLMSVWAIRPDGSGYYQYWYMPSGHIEDPAWSPDGEILAFTYFTPNHGAQLRYARPNANPYDAFKLGDDVEGVERYNPAWSADGEWIAYAAREGGQTDIYLMPSPLNPLFDGDWSPARLTHMGAARGPAWSPDGRRIAFVAERDDSFDLWLLQLELEPGRFPQAVTPQQLTSGAQVDATSCPDWAP